MSKRVTDYWTARMLEGNFEEAWKFSDEVLESRKDIPCWHLPRHQQYIWDGSTLQNKRVLIRCYHGLGDTIQFIRFAPLVQKMARSVIVWAQPPLIPLLRTMRGIDEILALHDGSPEIEYDVDVEVMELPHILRATTETIPRDFPYLHIDAKHLQTGDDRPLVGLCWRVGNWGESRSMPFDSLKPLFNVQGVRFVILQNDPIAAGWTEGFGDYPGAFSLFEFAQVIKALDLVITVDSMPAHVAGALARPVWVMVEKHCDWRWMEGREDSPWYPTAKVFRQHEENDWSGVVDEVRGKLKTFAKHERVPNKIL